MSNKITIGQTVHHDNRVGRVIEIAPLKFRARVSWTIPGRNLRTWVRFQDLTVIEPVKA